MSSQRTGFLNNSRNHPDHYSMGTTLAHFVDATDLLIVGKGCTATTVPAKREMFVWSDDGVQAGYCAGTS